MNCQRDWGDAGKQMVSRVEQRSDDTHRWVACGANFSFLCQYFYKVKYTYGRGSCAAEEKNKEYRNEFGCPFCYWMCCNAKVPVGRSDDCRGSDREVSRFLVCP
jgi:hypothetical protein